MHNHDVSGVLGFGMAYEWQLIRSNLAPPSGSEQWTLITLETTPAPLYYGFRLTLAITPPARWNTAGYFGTLQLAGGKSSMSRTYPIPLFLVGGETVIRALGESDFDFVGVGSVTIALVYMVHNWIDAEAMEIWGYYEI